MAHAHLAQQSGDSIDVPGGHFSGSLSRRVPDRSGIRGLLVAIVSALLQLSPSAGFSQAAARSEAFTGEQSDLQGVWMLAAGGSTFGHDAEALLTPWGADRFRGHRPTIGSTAELDANDPTLECLPPGLPYILMIPTPFEIVVAGGQLLQIFEYDHWLRRIVLDDHEAPAGLLDDGMFQWMGYSIGLWDDDTLVIETRGFNDVGWLDRFGHPRSTELVVIERLRRVDANTLVNAITITDPKAYTRPWTGQLTYRLETDWKILEHVCLTERDVADAYQGFKEQAWRTAD